MLGSLIISLDCELSWGILDSNTPAYQEHIRGATQVMPALLDCFDAYEIHATFAVVGMMLLRDRDQLHHYLPDPPPTYTNTALSPYALLEQLDELGLFFAPELIRMVQQRNLHEIASHTFSHYYCLEEGQTLDDFRRDLTCHHHAAERMGTTPTSIIFPRNQYHTDCLRACADHNITCFRGVQSGWMYQTAATRHQDSPLRRILRLIDSYINISGYHDYQPKREYGLINLPASRFLRAYSPKLSRLDGLKLRRITRAMTQAAKLGTVFHLWWHPHNFGKHRDENLRFLEQILQHYRLLHETYGFQSQTMAEVAMPVFYASDETHYPPPSPYSPQ
jgi:peptidoglycan/xylan/chitin deacetylase (PgdA/CDA1 family)